MILRDQDRAKLHADSRYQAIREAEARMMAALRKADSDAERAIAECETATGHKQPKRQFTYERSVVPEREERLFDLLRPRGDMVRVATVRHKKRGAEREVELCDCNTYWILAGGKDFHRHGGRENVKSNALFIHPDDLARIQSGELKGWRQKAWSDTECPPRTGVDPE